ncbi:MAG: hypothetical protein E6Q78_05310 [Rhodoferax sp.]|nr:MAG: hypothetical protein E6Q78_05310 [Rhodoferax sp.]
MNTTLQILHWLAGFIVLAEALNKLERTAPFAPNLSTHKRVVDGLKAMAWTLLALGGAGAIAPSFFGLLSVQPGDVAILVHQSPSFAETAVLVGFAVLIVRTRVKEG